MGNVKAVGIVLLVIGIAILVLSLIADPIGIGHGNARFGYKQILGVIVGAIVTVGGSVLILRKAKQLDQ